MGYWDFLRRNWRFVSFGFALTFFSAYGQTFYVSLFGAGIRGDFGLTHGEFGTAYSAGTLASALTLIWLGRLIDRVDLTTFVVAICGGMAVSTLAMAMAPNYAILTVAFFGLRLSGQGLMVHAAYTSMARYFETNRGKASALAQTGQPISQAIMPSVAVALTALVGWRATWGLISASVILVTLPLVLWLLRGQRARDATYLAENTNTAQTSGADTRQWSHGEVLRDPRFYAVMAALAAFPFMVTGLFFHQVHVAESKGWSLSWLAASFTLFAASTVLSALVAGSIVDRFSAVRVFPLVLFPLIVALVPLALFDGPLVVVPYMAFLGIAVGFQTPIANALLAEVYGHAHLGAIRAMVTSAMVFASAPAPALVGWAFDSGASVEEIAGWFLAYVAVATAICFAVAWHLPRPARTTTADT